ncbi:MAG: hypothetical protein Q9227_009535 [Pyrenula ochraceoflavens]
MQSFVPIPDIPVIISVPAPNPADPPLISAERRISPTWSVGQLKAKLESVTGISPGTQKLMLKSLGTLEPDEKILNEWYLVKGAEIESPFHFIFSSFRDKIKSNLFEKHKLNHVSLRKIYDTDPLANNAFINSTASDADKFKLSESAYASRNDSVLRWKQNQKLGRFDPNSISALSASERVRLRREKDSHAVEERGIAVGRRCRVNESDERRGMVKFVGEVKEIKGKKMPGSVEEQGFEEDGAIWVGVEFYEPVGKNDGTIEGGKRYFECKGAGHGSFVRPDRVECGDKWAPLDELEVGSDMEEI